MPSSLRGLKRSFRERYRGSQFTWTNKKISEDDPIYGTLSRICKLNLPYSMQTSFSENIIDFDYVAEFNL